MKELEMPILFSKKEECCGCAACLYLCPTRAISMETDEEGFSYPKINDEMCIRCNKCVRGCHFKNADV